MIGFLVVLGALVALAKGEKMVSYWFAPENTTWAKIALSELNSQGNSAIASTFFLYCGDQVLQNGTFKMGVDGTCDFMISELQKVNIGAERVVGAPNIDALRAMFKSPTQALAGMTTLVKEKNLTGISFDVEPSGSVWEDAMAYGKFLGQLRSMVNPLGVRVTTYSNGYSMIISDIADYIDGVDRVLAGETYNGANFSAWLVNYHDVVNDKWSKSKIAPGMLAYTERGDWNCESDGMAQRLAQLEQDGIEELALFSFDGVTRKEGCIEAWFPFARKFLSS